MSSSTSLMLSNRSLAEDSFGTEIYKLKFHIVCFAFSTSKSMQQSLLHADKHTCSILHVVVCNWESMRAKLAMLSEKERWHALSPINHSDTNHECLWAHAFRRGQVALSSECVTTPQHCMSSSSKSCSQLASRVSEETHDCLHHPWLVAVVWQGAWWVGVGHD